MTLARLHILPIAVLAVLAVGTLQPVLATTRIVNPSASVCDSSATPSPCYRTISAALTAATSGDTIEIHPATYTGTIALTKNLTITGTETARTILSGGGSGPIITIDGLTSVTIRKLSFTNSSTGILIKNSSTVTISNNVFRVGTGGTGVNIESSSSATIGNNTFYQNLNALTFASGTTVTILNNVFANNAGTAVSTTATASSIHNNCYYGNTTNGQMTTDSPTTDVTTNPLFADTSLGDFHLRSGSPCIDAGDTSVGNDSIDTTTPDIGAYGGPNADTLPYPVQNLTAVDVSPPDYTVQLTWNANPCYQVTGYKIYYGTSSGSYGTPTDALNVTTYPVSGLTGASAPTGAPVLTNGIANQTLLLSWNTAAVSGATGYEVRYSDTVTPPVTPAIDVENVSSYALTGLTNGTSYYVSVTPYAQQMYYFTVTAYYNSTNPAFESAYSTETSQAVGSKQYGTSSNIIYDYPEPITPIPNLPNSGGSCFIATAAYGDSSAPPVRLLREFRDRYLLTNAPGRVFVRWYYEYGPIAAEFVNAHPWLKPIVRTALLPAVGGAFFATRMSDPMKIILFAVLGLLMLCAILKFRNRRSFPRIPR